MVMKGLVLYNNLFILESNDKSFHSKWNDFEKTTINILYNNRK